MDEFKELREALEQIAAFNRGSGSVGGDCEGILKAVKAKIEAYIRRKSEPGR
jgi:hypothetical protein